MSKGKLRIYGCGGAGVNITKGFSAGKEALVAEIFPAFIDTSDSNVAGIDIAQFYKIESADLDDVIDGSGKVRRENSAPIANSIKDILLNLPPMDFNIVVCSASGGSGSVIGPMLTAELLKRGEAVVIVLIGSEESKITTQNTVNTILSLDQIARNGDVPVIATFSHNTADTKRSQIDAEVRWAISCLAWLASGEISELDTSDVNNWLRFNKVTQTESQLALLQLYADPSELPSRHVPISIASVMADPDEPSLQVVPEYHCAGYAASPFTNAKSMHFAIATEPLPIILKALQVRLAAIEEVANARKQAPALTKTAVADSSGMVY